MLAESSTGDAAQIIGADISARFQIDLRYSGQGLVLTVDTSEAELESEGLSPLAARFDRLHEQLFTFSLDAEKELVYLRVVVEGPETDIRAATLADADKPLEEAEAGDHVVFVDGQEHAAKLYDRAGLGLGHEIHGPAVIMEMDSTTLILPGHKATIDHVGNLLIRPMNEMEE